MNELCERLGKYCGDWVNGALGMDPFTLTFFIMTQKERSKFCRKCENPIKRGP